MLDIANMTNESVATCPYVWDGSVGMARYNVCFVMHVCNDPDFFQLQGAGDENVSGHTDPSDLLLDFPKLNTSGTGSLGISVVPSSDWFVKKHGLYMSM